MIPFMWNQGNKYVCTYICINMYIYILFLNQIISFLHLAAVNIRFVVLIREIKALEGYKNKFSGRLMWKLRIEGIC